jgi:hypothetical protein
LAHFHPKAADEYLCIRPFWIEFHIYVHISNTSRIRCV